MVIEIVDLPLTNAGFPSFFVCLPLVTDYDPHSMATIQSYARRQDRPRPASH